MTLSGLDVIARCDDFEDRAAAYELRAWQWAFLHALDGKTELRDAALAGGIDIELALDFVQESQAAGLVQVVSMTLDEYRRSIGLAAPHVAVAAPPTAPETHGDHFSASDTLGSYEHTVPAWMIEHDDTPAHAPLDVADLHDVPVLHDEPVAAEQPEAATPDATPAYASDSAISAPEHHDEAIAEHHDEAVAEHHDEAVPWYQRDADAHPAEVVAEHDEEAVAEHHDDPVSAAQAVAGLVSLGAAEPPESSLDTQEHAAEPVADAASEGHPVWFSFGKHAEPESEPPTNGHATALSWEPMSLVTSVDESAPVHADDGTSNDVPEGISIRLSSHSSSDAGHDDVFGTPPPQEKGSISFSFSPEDPPRLNWAPVTTPAEPIASEHDSAGSQQAAAVQEPPVAYEPIAHEPVADEPAADEPVADEPVADEPASDEHAASQPVAREAQLAVAAAEPVTAAAATPSAAPASSATADIVGNLISRALTFRIK